MADQSADDRLRLREAALPFSPRRRDAAPPSPPSAPVPAPAKAAPSEQDEERHRIRVKRMKEWTSGAMELVPDLIRMLRKILADVATFY